jgi:hypothetical protein
MHKFQVVEAFTILRPIFLPAARIGAVLHNVHPPRPGGKKSLQKNQAAGYSTIGRRA